MVRLMIFEKNCKAIMLNWDYNIYFCIKSLYYIFFLSTGWFLKFKSRFVFVFFFWFLRCCCFFFCFYFLKDFSKICK
jgi:hypothetical protein